MNSTSAVLIMIQALCPGPATPRVPCLAGSNGTAGSRLLTYASSPAIRCSIVGASAVVGGDSWGATSSGAVADVASAGAASCAGLCENSKAVENKTALKHTNSRFRLLTSNIFATSSFFENKRLVVCLHTKLRISLNLQRAYPVPIFERRRQEGWSTAVFTGFFAVFFPRRL